MIDKIKFRSNIVISDPCHSVPTSGQIILDNVLHGEYVVHEMTSHCGDLGIRPSTLMVIHEKYEFDDLEWEQYSDTITVDSGLVGIFSKRSYRNDKYKLNDLEWEQYSETIDVFLEPSRCNDKIEKQTNEESGHIWCEKIFPQTPKKLKLGMYDEGVISNYGFGGGTYHMFVVKKNRKIIGIFIDFCFKEEKELETND